MRGTPPIDKRVWFRRPTRIPKVPPGSTKSYLLETRYTVLKVMESREIAMTLRMLPEKVNPIGPGASLPRSWAALARRTQSGLTKKQDSLIRIYENTKKSLSPEIARFNPR